MADRIIQTADLSAIRNYLAAIHDRIEAVDTHVDVVEGNVNNVETELSQLTEEFHAFVEQQTRANRQQVAETRVVKLRQELQKEFGHYSEVRRTATGILEATDLGIIREESIRSATESLMLKTPRYWLAPCLVALAAWIADKKELAEKAMREGLHRDDEKTSLFFALVCRRADRKLACVKWVSRYLGQQDAEQLDRKAILVLAAYANDLWGRDLEGEIARTLEGWLTHLRETPGFLERQQAQWEKAIALKIPGILEADFPYLKRYSPTWPQLDAVLRGACLHSALYQYFTDIFEQENATGQLKDELDATLDSLVTDFDDEELPLREKERFEQLVIDCGGDEGAAQQHMDITKTAFETRKDFTQLLTDAAMNPTAAHADAATQKFAIALSKDWILDAYRDTVAKNRSKVPQDIELKLEDFHATTQRGENEREILANWNTYIDAAQEKALEGSDFTAFGRAAKWLRWVLLAAALLGFFVSLWITLLCGAAAFFVQGHYAYQKKRHDLAQKRVEDLETNRPKGEAILHAALAEAADVRALFEEKDSESQKTLDYLSGLAPSQFLGRPADGARRIQLSGGR